MNFSLEEEFGGKCLGDFVEIKDGGYETSPLLGKYCGSTTPPRIISHSNKLWLQFKSDVVLSSSGFSAYWDGSLTGCGGNLTTPTGTFTSPNYPMPYYHSSECYWWLKASQGSPFELEFEEFHLEHHPNCTLDYLAVYDGPGTSSHLLTQLCGDEKPPLIRSSGDSMFLKLRTDEVQQGGGFLAKYHQTCENVVIVNRTYGILESIHYPNPYSHNQRCNWTIQATTGNTVNYTFLEFELEYHLNCSHDYLEIYDGSRRIGRYCGKDMPPSGSTTGSVLQVLFHTDGVGNKEKGFQMQWFVHGCGAELSGAMGSFSSPGYPNTYPPSKECIWYIHTAPGSSIQLTIHDFDVEYHESCRFDVLEIYGGPDFHSPRIAQLCTRRSPENPMQVSSTGHELAIRFKTDSMISGRGFNVSWQAVPGGCGGIFLAPSGEIHSPNYPSPYRSNTDCSWVIRAERNHRVLLNFTDFDLEPQDSCIIAYDGLSSATTRLARACGRQQLTNPITSSGNSLFVRFQSGPSRQSRGFQAHFRQVCGGYILTDSFDTISSPLFPAKYPDNQNCSWIIQAQPPFNHITLSFTHFGLESSTTCTQDFLEILDGNYDDAPLRGRYCGTSMPHPITSFSNALTVRFISDSSVSFGGFHATYAASSSACGGDFHMAEGTFDSPGYPEVYPSNVECVWNIVSSPGNRLQLSFITFQLEDSQDCSRDFVEIREENATGHLVGRYCGNTLPLNYSSIVAHNLWIRFVSDGSGSGTGFQATFANIFGNDNIVGTHGKVASPLWPGNYPHNSDYQWIVNVNASQVVHGRILEMDIESTHNCYYDKLRIYDGAGIHSRPIGTYCGAQTDSFSSTGSSLTFQFSSDSSVSGKGFLLEWFAVDAAVGPLPTIATGACGGFLRTGEVPAFLFSPGWPQNYGNRADCVWLIQAPDSTVELNILSLDIESHGTCNYDKLVIRDGDNNMARQLAVLCGREIPGPIRSTGEFLWLRFTSDFSVTRAGFNASFHKSCGGYLHANRGIITSPNYPETYPPNLNCSWHILVPSGLTIAVHFEQPFQIANGDSSCNEGDYLAVFNGIRSNSPVLGKLCSSVNISDEIKSSGNTMKVIYFTDGSRPYGGFSASYTSSEDAVCGGALTSSPEGNFTSPGYNGVSNYSRNLNCEWTLSNPNQGNSSIYIHFEDFYLESHQDCQFDVLEFRVGNADGPLIWRLCGPVASTVPLVIPYSQVWIHFVTNERVEHTGFHAEYFFTDCGGIQTGESGVIASPNYPASYDSLTHCAWLLEVPEGDTITLTFSDFDIESHSTCAWDSVTVRNGGSPGSPIIGHYCGTSSPSPIRSGSNQLVVIFNSDHSVQNGGFYATWSAHTLGPIGASSTFTAARCQHHVTDTHHIPCCPLVVWAGTEEMDKALLATSCGNVAPGAIITPRNAFTAVFQSQEAPAPGFSASFVSRCGSNFTKPSGYIISPNYPKQYDNNMNCTYFIEANPLSVVSLTFVSFHLEARSAVTGSCDNDGLHIIRGHSVASTPFATVCGDEVLSPVTISGPALLNFYSNSHTTDFGFKLSYQITSCGGVFNFSTGIIKSPAYSYSDYPNDMYCLYNITVRDNKVILLKFTDFDVVLSTSCSQDYLAIYDGYNISDPLLGKFCGSKLPPNVKSSNNSMLLVFKTDAFQTARGWVITFRQTLGSALAMTLLTCLAHEALKTCKCVFKPAKPYICLLYWCHNTVLLSQPIRDVLITLDTKLVDIGPQQGCGGYLTGSNGTFASPDSDANGRYDKNLNCIWFIIAPVNKLIKLTFNTFALESASALQRCIYDYVKLYDGESENAKLAGTFCGSTVPAPFVSSGNFLTVQFVSDISLEREGFNATYTFIDMICGGTYNATWTPQNISSPNASNPDVPLTTCTWVFEAPVHQQVEITVWAFQLQSRDCHQNYLEFQDTPESSGNARIHLCGRNATAVPTFYSSMSTAIVIFKSEVFNDNSRVSFTYQIAGCNRNYKKAFGNLKSPGWPANYNNDMDCTVTLTAPQNHSISLFFHSFGIEDSSCGGTLYGDHGSFTSPGYPGTYPNHTHCEWAITAPAGRLVTVNFYFISIDDPGDCVQNYLLLYDGPDVNSPSSGPYCGTDTNIAPFVASSHRVFVEFHAEYAGPAPAWAGRRRVRLRRASARERSLFGCCFSSGGRGASPSQNAPRGSRQFPRTTCEVLPAEIMSKSLKKLVEESREKNQPEVDMSDRGISNMLDVHGLCECRGPALPLEGLEGRIMSKSLKKLVEESREKNQPEVDMSDRGISNMLDVHGLFSLSHITQLVLSHNKLTTVPANIAELKNLEVLNFFNNQIEELPTQISSLQKLKHLNLGMNRLNTLPRGFGSLPALEVLDLTYNNLNENSLPGNFFYLTTLRALYLSDNDFEILPPDIGKLTKLQILSLRDNDLISLPKEIGELTQLKELHIQGNRLTVLPPELGNLDLTGQKQVFKAENNPWVTPIADQFQLGVSHVFEYIRSETYKYLYGRHMQANPEPPKKNNDKSKKISRKPLTAKNK
ncbi:Cubilin [Myotis davidii]|uniref:Ras suppressor protein 1 n=8 Tax=Amniota TaxID=32524 RepID=L5LR26_MYODS|nr:Cubilin [Myotis davidii]